nr:hypothetical protein [Tanacetum cinerariifolium]
MRNVTHRTEAVIPAEIRMPTYRTAAVDVVYNDEELRIREAKAKLKMPSITMLGFAALLLGQVISSTAVMTPVMRWQEGS